MKNTRVRNLLVPAVCLVTIGAAGAFWATSSQAATSRFTTASVATGDVSQSYLTTGSVSRNNVVDATFSVSGTVKKVRVAVGDQVAAGDVLATLDTTALKLELLNAQTDLASAKAARYAAEHPSSTTRSSGGGSTPSLPSGGSTSPGGGGTTGGITARDAALLYQAISAVNVASLKWSNPEQPTICDAIYSALLNANEQEPTPEPTPEPSESAAPTEPAEPSEPSTEPTAEPTPEPTPEPTAEPSPEPSDQPTTEPTDQPTAEPSDQPSTDDTEQLALVVDDITLDDIKACGEAREALVLANSVLGDYYQQLIATGTIVTGDQDATPTTPSTGSATSKSSTKSATSSSSSATVSQRAVASAEADVLRAQQKVDSAESALGNAELVAPIAGTVGSVGLTAGARSSAGAVIIVGEGTAVVSFEAPLATRAALSQGMAATITPAGAATSLTGTVSSIAVLETSGTAGDNPTYTTTVVVEDPDMLLKEGAKAGVEIVTGTATGVLTVPASAVTPTGTGTGTVQVVDASSSDTAEIVTVATGAVGGGRVEITEGLTEGQLVVLSDRTLDIDALTSSSATTNRRGGFALPR